jgi:hypothetical protein
MTALLVVLVAACAGDGGGAFDTVPTTVPTTSTATTTATTTVPRTTVSTTATTTVPTTTAPTTVERRRVLVVGDSLAVLLASSLQSDPRAASFDVTNGGRLGCGLLRGTPVRYGVATPNAAVCDGWPERFASLVRSSGPSVVVVLSGFWDLYDWMLEGRAVSVGEPAWDAYARRELGQVASVLGAGGARLVWVQPPYFLPIDPTSAEAAYAATHGSYRSAYDDERVDHFATVLAGLGAGSLVDARACLCPGGAAVVSIDGVDVRGDGVHLTDAGAALLIESLLSALR